MEYNNDYNYQENNVYENVVKRPTGLTVLCVLTFIGSGLSILSYLLCFFTYDMLPNMMLLYAESLGGSLGEVYENAAEMFTNTARYAFLLMTIPFLTAIVGAGFMLKMRKLGFHLYVVGQILIAGFRMLILQWEFDMSGLLISILFIALYAIYLKKMR